MHFCNDLLKTELENFNFSLKKIFLETEENLGEFLIEFSTKNSKKIRPIICYLLLKSLNSEIKIEQEEVILVTELVHDASLIHDDVIDKSEVRREGNSLNKKFGNSLAVISGDLILSLAMKKLISLNSFEILNIYTETIKSMCDAEINQYFKKYKMPTLEEYIEKSKEKTALLFVSAIKSLVIFDDNLKKYKKELEDFALNFGIAFQVRNDIKDVLDKKFNDKKEGIYTCYEIFNKSIEKSKDLMDNYFEEAIRKIEFIENNDYKKAILKLINFLREI